MAAERQLGLDAVLERLAAQLVQPTSLRFHP